MHICHVINSMGTGGAETRLLSILNEVDPDVGRITLTCLQASGEFLAAVPNRVHILDLGVKDIDGLPSATEQFSSILDDIKPDIVHTHLVQASLVGRAAIQNRKTRPVLLSTQHNAWNPKDSQPLYQRERQSWQQSEGFIAISHATANYLRAGGYAGPIVVCPTGVKVPRSIPSLTSELPVEGPFILAVGHMRDRQKGHDTLIRGFQKVVNQKPGLNLLIAGEGPLQPDFRNLACQLGIGSKVHFLGNRSDTMGLMARCSVFVLASRWEGFGRVLVEAMAVGAAIVATRVEAVPEVVHHEKSGLLVAPEDEDALSSAMLRLLHNNTLALQIGSAALRDVCVRFSLTDMIASETAFYRAMLGSKGE